MARLNRAWCPQVAGEGALVTLDREQSHHVAQVLRLRAGDALELFDGAGRAWSAQIVAPDRSQTQVRAGPELFGAVESPYRVTLCQSLCRPERLEWVVQKATEVGVHAIRLVRAQRAEAGDPSPDRLERLRRIAREAARQSCRTIVPEVAAPEDLPDRPAEAGEAFVLDPRPDSPPLAEALAAPAPASGSLLIGPEGGLEDAEIERLERGGWRRAGLGPRVLRTETAGVVACALLLHLRGDLGARHSGLSGLSRQRS